MIQLDSPEAEKATLCCLFHPDHGMNVLGVCISLNIRPEHFVSPAHATIYRTILALNSNSEPIDTVTVTGKLRDSGHLEDCGGAFYLSDLSAGHGIPSNIRSYCADLDEKRRIRGAHELSRRIQLELESPLPNPSEWFSGIVEEASGLRAGVSSLKSPTQSAREFLDFYEKVETGAPMISVGIDSIDLQAGPFMRGDLVVVSGVTGGGKSALVNSIVDRSIDLQQCVGVFTLEMTSIQYIERIAAARKGVNMHGVRQLLFKRQRINPEIFDRIGQAVNEYAKSSIYISDDVYDLAQLEARCAQINARKQLDMIVLDYAQLLSAPGDTREREVANVSKGMKRLATKLGCVSILLSQLNDDGRLRESRAIGHDANVVLNIERDDKSTWVKVSKGRSCAGGTKIPLKWIPEFTKFEDIAENI